MILGNIEIKEVRATHLKSFITSKRRLILKFGTFSKSPLALMQHVPAHQNGLSMKALLLYTIQMSILGVIP